MIVDCHTHVFPNKIAPRVMEMNRVNLGLEPYGTGTVDDLLAYLEKAGIAYACAFGVAPEGRFVKATNDWLSGERDPRLLKFGTITPDYPEWESEVDRIKAAGMVGIKFNPLFQEIIPDDPVMDPLYEKLAAENLIVYYHAGRGEWKNRPTKWCVPRRNGFAACTKSIRG